MVGFGFLGLIIIALIALILIAWLITSIILFSKSQKGSPQRVLHAGMIIGSSCCIFIGGAVAAIILYFTMNPISFM